MSAFVKCAGCGVVIEIPDELAGDWNGDMTSADDPYYCDECELEEEEDHDEHDLDGWDDDELEPDGDEDDLRAD